MSAHTEALKQALPEHEPIREEGPWHVSDWHGGRLAIQSDDFTHDAALEVSGDFGGPELKKRYAQHICDKLNAPFSSGNPLPNLAAALSLPDPSAAPVVPQWLPIESAPKSSKHILAYGEGCGFTQCSFIASWGGAAEGWLESYTSHPAAATHWMPLPPAPQQGEQAGQEGEQG